MSALRQFFVHGGPALVAIVVLSVLLYARCCGLFLYLWQTRRQLADGLARRVWRREAIARQRQELQETFRQQRVAIGAMIAAAPLLGLLGTVMGMIGAFDSLAAQGGQRSMEGLAQGISEVLVDTESGLAVAIPALLLLYFAHRLMEKGMQTLSAAEAQIPEES